MVDTIIAFALQTPIFEDAYLRGHILENGSIEEFELAQVPFEERLSLTRPFNLDTAFNIFVERISLDVSGSSSSNQEIQRICRLEIPPFILPDN